MAGIDYWSLVGQVQCFDLRRIPSSVSSSGSKFLVMSSGSNLSVRSSVSNFEGSGFGANVSLSDYTGVRASSSFVSLGVDRSRFAAASGEIAAIDYLSQCCERRGIPSSVRSSGSNSEGFGFGASVSLSDYAGASSSFVSRVVVRCMFAASSEVPSVSETKSDFLKEYKRPIPSSGSCGLEFDSGGYDYDVFLNFRGPDTRHGFTDCLYVFMSEAGIRVFLDDEELRHGEKIGDELARAISSSKFYIPIFSRGYASSAWCLRELTMILDIKRWSSDRKILPIFYDVVPADVMLRTELFCSAIEGHLSRFDMETVEKWEAALREVGQIKGWDLQANQGQGKLIKCIIQDVSSKLKIARRDTPPHLDWN